MRTENVEVKKLASDIQDLLLRLGRFEYKDLEIA